MLNRRASLLAVTGVLVFAGLVAAWMLVDRGGEPPASAPLTIAAPGVATPPPTPTPSDAPGTPSTSPSVQSTPSASPAAEPGGECEPTPAEIAPVRVDDANPAAWIPPPLPGDAVCGLVGGAPWQPPEDLHDGGGELTELRARPVLLGTDAAAAPEAAELEDLQSLADAYSRWLATWPAAVRSSSSHPYAGLASPAALAGRDGLFVRTSAAWENAQPLCSAFKRSDAWLGAHIDGDTALTYSWRRGEAARCTDAVSGSELPTGAACVGPLYAVATRWERNAAGDPPWLVMSETHRDPLADDGAARFATALGASEWGSVSVLHGAYEGRIAGEESRSDYSACAPRPRPTAALPTRLVSFTAPPEWTPGAPAARFWIGTPGLPDATAIVIIGGDRVPYDGERVPVRDSAPDEVYESRADSGGGAVVTHCRDLPNGGSTCWARAGWLVADGGAQSAPWLGAPFRVTEGAGWDYCRAVSGEDLACWHDGFLPPAGSLPGRPTRLPADGIPAGLTDPLAPGSAFCRQASAPAGGHLCWIAYTVPDGGVWRPIVPADAIRSSGHPDPTVTCLFGADGRGRDRAFCAPTAEEAALIAADPDQQPVYARPDDSLCVRHAAGAACWAPRPDVAQHRPATWYVP